MPPPFPIPHALPPRPTENPAAAPNPMEEDDAGDDVITRKLKSAVRSRNSHLTRTLDLETIASAIMDVQLNLTVRQVLGLSKALQKIFNTWLRGELLPVPIIGSGAWNDWAETTTEVAQHVINALATLITPQARVYINSHTARQVNLHSLPTKAPWWSRELPTIVINIGPYSITALLDCGSQVNIMHVDLLERLKLPLRTDNPQVIVGAAQQESACSGITENVPTTLAGHTRPLHYFVQSASVYPVILGMTALVEFGIVLDCTSGRIAMTTPEGKQLQVTVVDPYGTANRQHIVSSAACDTEPPMPGVLRTNVHLLKEVEGRAWAELFWASQPMEFHVNAKKKAVKDKVNPSDKPPSASFKPLTLGPVPYDRDPYQSPLTPTVPPFRPTEFWTEERIRGLELGPANFITQPEKDLLLSVLEMHKECIAWSIDDIGSLKKEISPGFHVNVEDHSIFQDRTHPYPKAQQDAIMRLIAQYLHTNLLETSCSPYVTAHFVVPKKDGSWRLIYNCESANRITTPSAYPPPLIGEYIDGFVGRVAYSMLDLIQFFQQLPLAQESRQLYAIRTPYGLLQPTHIVPGGTTSPAIAQSVVDHVCGKDSPDTVCPFVDDCGQKGPRSRYDDELLPNSAIRKWVWEFAVSFERLLYRLKSAGLKINGNKMVVITNELDITGVKVSMDGKRADPKKVATLQDWPNPPPNQSSLRAFLGLANYLRPFIKDFALIDAPLRAIIGKRWNWSEEASLAMNTLKAAVAHHHFLGVIDYTSNDEIILSVDSSQLATGFVLSQVRGGERMIALYDSVGFTAVEQRYSQPKLELCGVYKAFRRLRYHLVGCRFTLEIDAISLVQMINNPDVANAAMMRWIANMKLFDFTIRRIPGKDHIIPDGLSRTDFGNASAANNWPDDCNAFSVNTHVIDKPRSPPPEMTTPASSQAPLPPVTPLPTFEPKGYEGRMRLLGLWLSTAGTHPDLLKLPRSDRNWIRTRLASFFVEDGRLWKRNNGGPALLVLGTKDDQRQALIHAHELHGHRGRDAILTTLLHRVWWETIRADAYSHIRSCQPCQLRSRQHETEPQRAAPIPAMFETFALDVVDLGAHTGALRYLVLARCHLTGWVEGRALPNKLASSIAKFIEDDILSRYGPVLRVILTDNGPENLGETENLLRRLGLRHAKITPNHPQGNAIVERGHAPIVEGLLKAAYDDRQRTASYLPQVLWADRITARRTTGSSPFQLVFGHEPLLPVDHDLRTLPMMAWEVIHSTSELLAARARLLRRRDDELHRAAALLAHARSQGRSYTDNANANRMRTPLEPGTMVLIASKATVLPKSQDKWMGPFRVHAQLDSGSYLLAELDGAILSRAYGSDRLRRYHPRPHFIQETRAFLDDPADDEMRPEQPLPAYDSTLTAGEIPADLSPSARAVDVDNDLGEPSLPAAPDLDAFMELPMHGADP